MSANDRSTRRQTVRKRRLDGGLRDPPDNDGDHPAPDTLVTGEVLGETVDKPRDSSPPRLTNRILEVPFLPPTGERPRCPIRVSSNERRHLMEHGVDPAGSSWLPT